LSWFRHPSDYADLPVTHDPREVFQIRFLDKGLSGVFLDGVLAYQFEEQKEPPDLNLFHKIEFLYNNDLWTIEYRRN